jgi:hypothetical protein
MPGELNTGYYDAAEQDNGEDTARGPHIRLQPLQAL